MKCWFIILTYNPSLSLLDKNLEILSDYNVVVVDNSADQEEIRKHIPKRVHGIFNEKNLGYTGGMNAGMKYAFKEGAEWVVLLNDDVALSKAGITKLLNTLTEVNPGIYGPYTGALDPKRWTTILAGGTVDYISGSFMAIHAEVNKKIQGFYPDFFMYYEDVDYCRQAKKKGFPIAHIDLPTITHTDGTSVVRGSDLHEYYLTRNHLLFVERQAPLGIKLHELIRLPKTLWQHKILFNKPGFQGILDFLFLRYGQYIGKEFQGTV